MLFDAEAERREGHSRNLTLLHFLSERLHTPAQAICLALMWFFARIINLNLIEIRAATKTYHRIWWV